MDIEKTTARLKSAAQVIPQIRTGLGSGADLMVLDRMLCDAIAHTSSSQRTVPAVAENFDKLETLHGGFGNFYRVTQHAMLRDEIRMDLTRVEALCKDIERMQALHYETNLRALIRMEPQCSIRMAAIAETMAGLRKKVAKCNVNDKTMLQELKVLEVNPFVLESDVRFEVKQAIRMRMR